MPKLIVSTLIVALCIVGYMLPFHSSPWPAALSDGVFCILGLVISASGVISQRSKGVYYSTFEFVVIGLVLTSIVVSSQILGGNSIYPYIISISIFAICTKTNFKEGGSLLIFGIWFSSTLTALIGIGLWLGIWQQLDNYQIWMAHAEPGARLSGNLAQPNNAGTFLIWGIASAVILSERIKTHAHSKFTSQVLNGGLISTVILISFASALTLSRTATINFIAFISISLIFRSLVNRNGLKLITLAFFIHIVVACFYSTIRESLLVLSETDFYNARGFGDPARIGAYKIFWSAIVAHPWFGYGVGGTTAAFVEYASIAEPLGQSFGHTHNLILELFLWFGIPLGILAFIALMKLFSSAFSAINSPERLMKFVMIFMVGLHSLLEYPLHYAYFLIPTAVFLSDLLIPRRNGVFVSNRNILICIAASAGLLFFTSSEYFRVERGIRQARVELAVTERAKPPSMEVFFLLKDLKEVEDMIRIESYVGMSSEQLLLFDRATTNFPMKPLIVKSITAFELNNQPEKAAKWQKTFRSIYGKSNAYEGPVKDSINGLSQEVNLN